MASSSHDVCLCTRLRRAARVITQKYDTALLPSGLRVTQHTLLRHLQKKGPMLVQNLAQELRLERTTLLRNLTVLTGHAYIHTITQGKSHTVCLAPAGEAALQRSTPLWEEAQKSIIGHLSADEREVLSWVLQKLENATD